MTAPCSYAFGFLQATVVSLPPSACQVYVYIYMVLFVSTEHQTFFPLKGFLRVTLQKGGLNVLIAACDTFRAGAVEQLRTHAR